MGSILGPRSQVQHRDDLGERIDYHPQPEDMCAAAQPTPQFIELKMREGEIVQEAVVECYAMFSGTLSQVVIVAWR